MLRLLLFNPSTWYICDFFLFHIEIENVGGLLGGGGKGYAGPPLKLLGGGGLAPLPPLPTPIKRTERTRTTELLTHSFDTASFWFDSVQ